MSETEIKKDHISRLHYLSYFTGIKYECIEYGTPGRWGDYIHKKNVKPTSVKLWYIKNEVFKYFDRFDELDRYCLIKLCLSIYSKFERIFGIFSAINKPKFHF